MRASSSARLAGALRPGQSAPRDERSVVTRPTRVTVVNTAVLKIRPARRMNGSTRNVSEGGMRMANRPL
jgi:hypothetical protein